MSLNCAIYCTVIDNFGDVGVCWRLARQLANEYGANVTLWVDDLQSFAQLAPSLDPLQHTQPLDNITVCLWQPEVNAALISAPLDLLIEGFGCRLPDQVMAKMVKQAQLGCAPLWINLEYLSAEPWIVDCHAMQSTHPSTGLVQYFWFPGIVEKSGGLLREADLSQRCVEYQASAKAQTAFWSGLGIEDAVRYDRRVSLFAYENVEIVPFLEALTADTRPSLLLVPHGKALTVVEAWARQSLAIGDHYSQGQLTIVVLPFLSHDDYDRLLWSCDLNLVRGEDSFVRAHWAGRPLLWHIYPQSDGVHLSKLDAYLDVVQESIPQPTSWITAMHLWNAHPKAVDVQTWSNLLLELPEWADSSKRWHAQLASQNDLCQRLMTFMAEKRKLPTSSR